MRRTLSTADEELADDMSRDMTMMSTDDVTVTSFNVVQLHQHQRLAVDVDVGTDVAGIFDEKDIQAADGIREADDDVSVTSVISLTSVAICTAAVAVLILLVFVIIARRKRLLHSTRRDVVKVENPRYCCRNDSCRYSKENILYTGPTVSLKSRGSSARQREIVNNSKRCHGDDTDDVMNDAMSGSSRMTGKYALYRPRPGKNVDHVTSGTNQHDAVLTQACPVEHNTGAVCRPSSELTFIYENVDKQLNLVASVTLESSEGRRSALSSRPLTDQPDTQMTAPTGRDSGFSDGGCAAAAAAVTSTSID